MHERTIEWEGPIVRTTWEAGPFLFPVERPRYVEERYERDGDGPLRGGQTHIVYGPWRVEIRGLGARAERRVLAVWEVHRSWIATSGSPRCTVEAASARGGSEQLALGASERHWLAASELRLGGASELYLLGASELRYLGASEMFYVGASEWRARGASERAISGRANGGSGAPARPASPARANAPAYARAPARTAPLSGRAVAERVNPMPTGYFALVLHAHLPFVRHPEDPTVMEEQWLYEGITGTYLPLVQMFEASSPTAFPTAARSRSRRRSSRC